MKRITFSLTGPQMAFLEQEASQLDISVAELVRRIIDEYRRDRPRR